MAKGQKRSSRELKKPKAKKPTAHEAAQTLLAKGSPVALNAIGKKKKQQRQA